MYVSNAATFAGATAAAAANGVASLIEVIAMSELEIAVKIKSLRLDQVFGEAPAVFGIFDAPHVLAINS